MTKFTELEQQNKNQQLLNKAIQLLKKVQDKLSEEDKKEIEDLIKQYYEIN